MVLLDIVSGWEQKITKTLVSKDKKEISISLLGNNFKSPHQLIVINTPQVKDTWDYGGDIYAASLLRNKITYYNKHSLRVDNQNYCYFSQVSNQESFSLYYKPPKWFVYVSITVYEYVGDVQTDSNLSFLDEQFRLLADIINSVDLSDQTKEVIEQANSLQFQQFQETISNQTTNIKKEVEELINPSQDIQIDLSLL